MTKKKTISREKWRITPAQRRLVCELYQTGLLIKEVAVRCGISPQSVSKILTAARIPRHDSARKPHGQPVEGIGMPITVYELPRRCRHTERFYLHTPPSPYFAQCVQEEWCAACAAKHWRKRQFPPDVIITKGKRRKADPAERVRRAE